MNHQQNTYLSNKIDKISNKFEPTAFTGSSRLLKNNLKIDQFEEPSFYLELLEDLEEVKRQTRVLFIHTVLNKVCIEEDKLYLFNTPYQASMAYSGVMKKEGIFYLKDEDGDLREVFDSENFQQFIDDQYWELYD